MTTLFFSVSNYGIVNVEMKSIFTFLTKNLLSVIIDMFNKLLNKLNYFIDIADGKVVWRNKF
jgi:hypothetical protein